MSVGAKAISIYVATTCVFVASATYSVSVPSQAWIALSVGVSSTFILAGWLSTLVCPRCGHHVSSRPIKWLHDFPLRSWGDVFHRRCRWCGYNLRIVPTSAPPGSARNRMDGRIDDRSRRDPPATP